MKIVLASIFILLSLVKVDSNIISSDYILVESGVKSLDKPIPTVVFTMERFDKTISMFGDIQYVNKCEFLQISDEIQQSDLVRKIDTTSIGYCNFYIVRKGKKSLYITSNNEATKKIFMLIAGQFQDKGIGKQVESTFTEIVETMKWVTSTYDNRKLP